jgi:glycosyltransferase involved in cell wall biosynthesis
MASKQTTYKVAVVSPTPFYYHAPLYRSLAGADDIDLMVYYCSDETLRGKDVQRMYGIKQSFSNEAVLQEYPYLFLKNYSPTPSYFKWPFGLMNFGVWNELRKGKYDLVILQSWTNVTWLVAFLAGRLYGSKVVFMTDENILAKDKKPFWKKILKRLLIGDILFKSASGFLTSGTANEQLYEYFAVPKQKLFRFSFSWGYNYVLRKADELLPQRSALRESMGIHPDEFVVLYVGRLAKEKNLFTLLDGYQSLSHQHKKLLLVGSGPLVSEIQDYINANHIPNVSFMGFQDRSAIFHFYAVADVLVLPSSYEPWGIVVNEAMCFKLPIVASDRVGAAVDMVKDGENGYLFHYQSAKELSHSIEKIMAMDVAQRERMGQSSRKHVEAWVASLDAPLIIKGAIDALKKKSSSFQR